MTSTSPQPQFDSFDDAFDEAELGIDRDGDLDGDRDGDGRDGGATPADRVATGLLERAP
jgi:hypothetical protein